MEAIKDLLKSRLPKPEVKKKFNYAWQVKADEVSTYFGKPLYWLFHKYYDWQVMNAYKVCKEKGITAVPYLLGILRNDSKNKSQCDGVPTGN